MRFTNSKFRIPNSEFLSAYAACEALARSHYENFPVASLLLPAAMRPHIAAVYAFARVADDIADEGSSPPEKRRTQLSAWQRQLHAAVALEPPAADHPEAAPALTDHGGRKGRVPPEWNDRGALIIAAVAHSIRSRDLPIALFDDLISAF